MAIHGHSCLFVEGGGDVVAGEAQGDGGVDVAVHVVALETEFVQLGAEQVQVGVVGGHFEGGTDVGSGIVEFFHRQVAVGTVSQQLCTGLDLDDLGEEFNSPGMVTALLVQ